jgi:RNA polymerase sigma-70 factor (ECF subfamily)
MGKLAELAIHDSLIAAVRAGDRAAAARLYDKVAGPAYGLARRLVGATLAEDVLQDSLMHMYAGLDRYRGDAPFGAWLRRIVVNQCLMLLRSPWQRSRVVWDDLKAERLTDGRDAAAGLDVARVLHRVGPTARAVLWLHVVEGLSHAEIAAAFGRTESFSKTQLARALQRLRSGEQVPWIAHTPPPI